MNKSRTILDISMSVDGFIAGPNRSLDRRLGEGELDRWTRQVESFRVAHAHTGAAVFGRRMFSGGEGAWQDDPNSDGWWGDDPPFRYPVFVVTHHVRVPVSRGATTFTFVTDGIESALEQAQAAAGERDVAVGGGASIARQFLNAGLVDELRLHVLPVLLGSGLRLFENHLAEAPRTLERIRTVSSPGGVIHVNYRVAG